MMILRLNLNKNLNSIQPFANATETQSQQGVGAVAGVA